MSTQTIEHGLYRAKIPGGKYKGFPVTHYGIIDIGNTLKSPGIDPNYATVLHLTPPTFRYEYIPQEQEWELVEKIVDIEVAKQRIQEALNNKSYDVFFNNCEQFANHVAKGIKVSGQVIGGIAALAGVAILVVNAPKLLKPSQL